MMALSIDVSNGKKKLECLKKQAEETCIPKTWAGLIHFMALSSVIRCSVFSVYPEASPGIRSLYHGLIHPRQEVTSTDVLYIMFTREGSLDGRTGSSFVPNHFCPLVKTNCTPLAQEVFSYNEADFPALDETLDSKTTKSREVFEPLKNIPNTSSVAMKRPYPLLSRKWYEKNGMLVVKKKNTSYKKPYLFNCQQLDEKLLEQKRFASERSKDEAKDLKFNFPNNKTPGFHELPTIADPESPFPPFGLGLFGVVKGTKDSVCSTVTYPFPLLPQLWYEKTGINAEHERKRKDFMTTLKITQSPSNTFNSFGRFLGE